MGERSVRRWTVAAVTAGAVVVAGLAPVPAAAAPPETIVGRVSAKADGTGLNNSSERPFTEKYGRFYGFTSRASNLVPGVTGNDRRVYLRDRLTDQVVLVSRAANGSVPSGDSTGGAVTPDGRYVAFSSYAVLTSGESGTTADVFVRDLWAGTTERVSVSSAELAGDGNSGSPDDDYKVDISDNGRYVAFSSQASNLVSGDVNGFTDVFVRDRTAGTTSLVSVNGASRGNGSSGHVSMSANGRYVAFDTFASNLLTNDTNGLTDVIRRDTTISYSVRASIGSGVANPAGSSRTPSISDDGTKVAFASQAADLVAGDTNSASDIFVRDVSAATTTRLSTTSAGGQLNGSSFDPAIQPDGQAVAFYSTATNGVAGDTNAVSDVFLKQGSTLTRMTGPGATQPTLPSAQAAVADGQVLWASSNRFTTTDTDPNTDVFVRRPLFVGPHSTLESFLSHQYKGFTGSAPSATVAARAALVRAGASPEHLVYALASSSAFSGRRAPVIRLYWSFFHRRPDKGGLDYWLFRYSAGTDLGVIAQSFAQSKEFSDTYGSTSNADFVKLVYQNVLGRQPDAAGTAYWVSKLSSGTSRGRVMVLFSESPEGKTFMAAPVDTVLIALGMYAQIPSAAVFDGIVDAIENNHQPSEIAVDYILGSPDYANSL